MRWCASGRDEHSDGMFAGNALRARQMSALTGNLCGDEKVARIIVVGANLSTFSLLPTNPEGGVGTVVTFLMLLTVFAATYSGDSQNSRKASGR